MMRDPLPSNWILQFSLPSIQNVGGHSTSLVGFALWNCDTSPVIQENDVNKDSEASQNYRRLTPWLLTEVKLQN